MRGESNYSWWEHYLGTRGDLSRLDNLKEILFEKGLKSFKDSFQDDKYSEGISLEYFVEMDCYYVINGQHRATMAKVVDAQYMLAEVLHLKFDTKKQEKYKIKMKEMDRINELLDRLNFKIIGKKVCWRNKSIIPLRVVELNSSIISLEDIVSVRKLLEKFSSSVMEVEDFQEKLSKNLFFRIKDLLLEKLGARQRLNQFEKIIYSLKNEGWDHKL